MVQAGAAAEQTARRESGVSTSRSGGLLPELSEARSRCAGGAGGVALHAEEAEAAERVGGEHAEAHRCQRGADEHEEVEGILHRGNSCAVRPHCGIPYFEVTDFNITVSAPDGHGPSTGPLELGEGQGAVLNDRQKEYRRDWRKIGGHRCWQIEYVWASSRKRPE